MTTRESQAFHRTFQQLGEQLKRDPGYKLFTISCITPDGTQAERIFTNMPEVYPVHGRKPRDQSAWSEKMARGECFVANRPEDFGEHFFDLSTIVALGLGAVINVPVFDGGRHVGGLNLLDTTGAYTGNVIDACRASLVLAVQGFREYEEFAKTRS